MDKGIRKTLRAVTKHMDFDEEAHIYKYKDKELTSVTTLLKPFFPFDADGIAEKLGATSRNPMYAGKSKEDILKMWELKRDLGTRVHKFIEDYLNGEFVSATCKREAGILQWLQKFKYEDVLTEQQICHPALGIAGMIDALIKVNGHWYIYDWKTDARIDTSGFRGEMCSGILNELPKCNFTKYKLQLGIYKKILSTFLYDIDIKGMKVVHINENGKTTEYTIPYIADEIELVLKWFNNN